MPKETKKLTIEEMPLETLEDYRKRNALARKINKEHKRLVHQIIPCPEEKHPTQRVIITFTNSSLETFVPVKFSNADIDYHKTLEPNVPYDLPEVIIEHLANRGTNIYDMFENKQKDAPNITKKITKVIGRRPRFAIRSV